MALIGGKMGGLVGELETLDEILEPNLPKRNRNGQRELPLELF